MLDVKVTGRPPRYATPACRKRAQREAQKTARQPRLKAVPATELPGVPPRPAKVPRRKNLPGLTTGVTGDQDQEKKALVLQMLGRGYSLAQCGRKALLSPDTVRVIADQALEEGMLVPPDPPDPKAAARALADFDYFRARYFGRVVMPWQSDAGKRLIGLKDDAAKEFVVLNVFPGSGKTSLFAHDLVAWFAVRDRSLRILIGSRTLRQAQMYTNRLRRTFSRLDLAPVDEADITAGRASRPTGVLTEDFGRFSPIGREEMWTADQFVLFQWGRAITEKEASFAAYGMDSGFLGGRFDIVVWDDLVDSKSMRTTDAREHAIKLYEDEIESRLEPGGLLVLQGQRMRTDDLYRHVLDMKVDADPDNGVEGRQKYHHIIYRAHHEDLCEGIDTHGADVARPWPDGCLLDPIRLPWREVATIRANREEKWAVLYQQEDVDPDKVLVQRVWIDGGVNPITGEQHPGCWDNERGLAEVPAGIGPYLSVATCDPSPTRFWCAAEGTLVLTAGGERPIEQIGVGERVLTRAGWRPVRAAARTGFRRVLDVELSNGRTVRLTPEHLVATPSGWLPARSLRSGVTLCGVNTGTRPAESLAGLADVEVVAGVGVSTRTVRPGRLGRDMGGTAHVVPMGLDGQMGDLDAGRVIAQVRNLASFRDRSHQGAVRQAVSQLLAVPTHLSGDSVSAAAVGRWPESGLLPFETAVRRTHRPSQEISLVNDEPLPGGDLPVPAGYAAFGLRTDDHRSAFHALHVVSVTDGSYCEVYDLDVEGEHEFVAEGLVVHNSIQWWLAERSTERHYLLDLVRSPLEAPEFLDWDHSANRFTGFMEDWQRRSIQLGAPITHWIVEINAARFLYQHDYVKRWQALHRVALIPHTTHLNRNDSEFGVQTIGPRYKFGQVRLPGKTKVDGGAAPGKQVAMKLVDELTRWPDSPTDDCVLAHWFLCWNLPRIAPPKADIPKAKRPSWL